MKALRPFGLIAATLLLAIAVATPARAALLWEFGIIGSQNNFSGSGSFALNGPMDSDGLADFEYTGICAGLACSFDLADVAEIDWDLNDTWEFTEFRIFAENSDGPDIFRITINLTTLFASCEDKDASMSCNGMDADNVELDYALEQAFLSPIHDAPEPASLALFLVGVIGLGVMARRRRSL